MNERSQTQEHILYDSIHIQFIKHIKLTYDDTSQNSDFLGGMEISRVTEMFYVLIGGYTNKIHGLNLSTHQTI